LRIIEPIKNQKSTNAHLSSSYPYSGNCRLALLTEYFKNRLLTTPKVKKASPQPLFIQLSVIPLLFDALFHRIVLVSRPSGRAGERTTYENAGARDPIGHARSMRHELHGLLQTLCPQEGLRGLSARRRR